MPAPSRSPASISVGSTATSAGGSGWRSWSSSRRPVSGFPPHARLRQHRPRSTCPHRTDILLVLEQYPQGLLHLVRRQVVRSQRQKRRRPIEGLRDARRFGEVGRPEPLYEGDDLLGKRV